MKASLLYITSIFLASSLISSFSNGSTTEIKSTENSPDSFYSPQKDSINARLLNSRHSSALMTSTLIDDSAICDEDESVVIDVLDNDLNVPADAGLIITSQPASGSVVINSNKTITYTPAANVSGCFEFDYSVAQNPPVLVANKDAFSTDKDVVVKIPILENDIDPEGDDLTPVIITQPINGSAMIMNDSVAYTPNNGFSGQDQLTYQVSDGNGNTSSAVVTINVKAGEQGTIHYLPLKFFNNLSSFASGQPTQLWINTENATGATGTIKTNSGVNLPFTVGATNTFTLQLSNSNDGNVTAIDTSIGLTDIMNSIRENGIIVESNVAVNVQLVQEASVGQSFLNSKSLNALGTEFYVAQQSEEGSANKFTYAGAGTVNAPQQGRSIISVMASEDNTEVTFIPPPNNVTWEWTGSNSDTIRITIDRGECYMISSTLNTQNVTGAKVTSTKPIAVSSGTFDINYTNGGGAVDNGWDMLVPVQRTGTEYVVISTPSNPDEAYVIATENNTTVHINGNLEATLQEGEFHTLDMSSNALGQNTADVVYFIETNHPSYVFQNSGQDPNRGENGLALIAPINPSGQGTFRFRTTDPTRSAATTKVEVAILSSVAAHSSFKIFDVTNGGNQQVFGLTAKGVPNQPNYRVYLKELDQEKEYRVQSDAFVQIMMRSGEPIEGGGLAYISGFNSSVLLAADDNILVTENTAISFSPLVNDIDADGNAITISNFTNPANGLLNNNNGVFTFTPNNNFTGTTQFSYTISNGQGFFSTATVFLSVESLPTATVSVTVHPIVDDPGVSATGGLGEINSPIPVNITIAGSPDTDGSESLSSNLTIMNVPSNISFSAGSAGSGNTWVLPTSSLSNLTATTTEDGAFLMNACVNNTDTESCIADEEEEDILSHTYAKSFVSTNGVDTDSYCASFMVSTCPAQGSLVITEIMKDPAHVTDSNGEYFEVFNPTSNAIEMNGMTISDNGSNTHTINSSVIVPSMGYVVFGRNTDNMTNGGIDIDYAFSFTLTNAEDEIIISCNGTVIDSVYYDSDFPNTAGVSMVLDNRSLTANANDSSNNWCGSKTAISGTNNDKGTPGLVNDNCCVITITNVAFTNETCPNAKNGTITVSATCTTCDSDSDIRYSLDSTNFSNTSGVFTGLTDSTYHVYIHDSKKINCTSSQASVVIGTTADNEKPTFTCPIATTSNLSNTCTISIPDLVSTVTNEKDNCGVKSFVQIPLANSIHNSKHDSIHVVTLTVTDDNDNTSTCTVNVTAKDVTSPTFTCPSGQNVILNGDCNLVVPDLISSLTDNDNCDATFTQNPIPGTELPSAYGTMHTITITATDLAGNTNSSNCNVVLTGAGNQTWYIDADNDGYGVSSVVQCARPANGKLLSELAPASTGTDDCDDSPDEGAAINPGAIDIPGDMIDQDCSGSDALKLSIVGNSVVCPDQADEIYTISNRRDDATYQWTINGNGLLIKSDVNSDEITIGYANENINAQIVVAQTSNGVTYKDTFDVISAPPVICALTNCVESSHLNTGVLASAVVPDEFHTSRMITSDAIVFTQDYTFRAGEIIEFQPGFTLIEGRELLAEIMPCISANSISDSNVKFLVRKIEKHQKTTKRLRDVSCTLDIDNDNICDDVDQCIDIDGDGYGIGSGCIAPDCFDDDPLIPFDDEDCDGISTSLDCDDGDGFVGKCDGDGDGVPDDEDNCPDRSNPNQSDSNNNGIGDECEPESRCGTSSCSDGDPCTTGDEWDANCNCIGTYKDSDGDGVCDYSDKCEGYDDNRDWDNDGVPDGCDEDAACTDCTPDVEGKITLCWIPHNVDNMKTLKGDCEYIQKFFDKEGRITDQNKCGPCQCEMINDKDTDGDGICDRKDECPDNPDKTTKGKCDCENTDQCDEDGDGVVDYEDNCPSTPNSDQSDSDNDGLGDVCDDDQCIIGAQCDDGNPCTENDQYNSDCNCIGTEGDDDLDGVCNALDKCHGFKDYQDEDKDGIPDGCDVQKACGGCQPLNDGTIIICKLTEDKKDFVNIRGKCKDLDFLFDENGEFESELYSCGQCRCELIGKVDMDGDGVCDERGK